MVSTIKPSECMSCFIWHTIPEAMQAYLIFELS